MVKSNITFTDDIVKEVAKELGLTEDEVMQVYNLNIKYIRHLMDGEETCAVEIPYLGTAHINKGLLIKSLDTQEAYQKKGWNIDLEKYQKNLRKRQLIEELDKERKEAGTGTSNHSKRTILKKLKFKTGKNLDKIEDIQKEKNGENK